MPVALQPIPLGARVPTEAEWQEFAARFRRVVASPLNVPPFATAYVLHSRRPSKMPLLMACAASHRYGDAAEAAVQSTDDAPARLGRVVHEVLGQFITTGDYQACYNRAASSTIWANVPGEDARYLFREGVRLLREVQQYFPSPENGTLLEGTDFPGTDDVHCVGEDYLAVGDWKTGWGMQDAFHQIMAYLYLLRLKYPGRLRFYGFVWYCRHDYTQRIETDNEGLDRWYDEYQQQLAMADDIRYQAYRINPHCENCPRLLFCPAIKAAAAAFQQSGYSSAGPIVRDPHSTTLLGNLQHTRNAVKAFKRMVATVEATTEALVDAAGGRLVLPDQSTLTRRVSWRKGYVTERALPVLAEIFGPATAGSIAKITTAAIKRAIVQQFPGRPVSAILSSIMDRLAAADAITEYPVTHISSMREGVDDATAQNGDE